MHFFLLSFATPFSTDNEIRPGAVTESILRWGSHRVLEGLPNLSGVVKVAYNAVIMSEGVKYKALVPMVSTEFTGHINGLGNAAKAKEALEDLAGFLKDDLNLPEIPVFEFR